MAKPMDNSFEITFPVFQNDHMNLEYLFMCHVFSQRKWKHSFMQQLYNDGMLRVRFIVYESDFPEFKEMVKACHPWFAMEYEPYHEYAMTDEQECELYNLVESIVEYINENYGGNNA